MTASGDGASSGDESRRDDLHGIEDSLRELGATGRATWDAGRDAAKAFRILVSADIAWKRENIRKNVLAWLSQPHLGMVPLFMAGDKFFYYYCDQVRKQTGVRLNIWGVNPLENTDFKVGPAKTEDAVQWWAKDHYVGFKSMRALRWAGVLLGLAVALCLLMWSTTCRGAIQHVDDAVFHAAENTEWGPAVGFAKVLAFVGGTLVTWCIRVVVLVVLARRRHWLSAAAFALAIVTSEMLIGGLKDAYQRPRPPNGGPGPVHDTPSTVQGKMSGSRLG